MKNINTVHIIKKIALFMSIPLLAAIILYANISSGKKVCKQLDINITNSNKVNFVSRQDIINTLITANNIEIGTTLVKDIHPKQLELVALSNKWVQLAEVYFSGNTLHITITQKEPIVRVIQNQITNEYYDKDGKVMAVCTDHSANVPIFTTPRLLGDAKSNKLKQDILTLSKFINADTFWNAMIAQVDVNSNYEFDLVPQVGKQIIHFGNVDMIEDKFSRLLKFYQEVLPKVGWQRYSALNVKYKKQIVASLVDSLAKVSLAKPIDSILRKNIQQRSIASPPKVQPLVAKALPSKPIKREIKPIEKSRPVEKKVTVAVKNSRPTQPTAQTTYTVNRKPNETNAAKSNVATLSNQKRATITQKPNVKLIDAKKDKQHKTQLPQPKTIKPQNIKDEYQ